MNKLCNRQGEKRVRDTNQTVICFSLRWFFLSLLLPLFSLHLHSIGVALFSSPLLWLHSHAQQMCMCVWLCPWNMVQPEDFSTSGLTRRRVKGCSPSIEPNALTTQREGRSEKNETQHRSSMFFHFIPSRNFAPHLHTRGRWLKSTHLLHLIV